MWWQKSVNDRSEAPREQLNNRGIKPTESGLFDFERILRELDKTRKEICPSDVLFFPEPLRSTINYAIRTGRISLVDFANMLKLDVLRARRLADLFIAKNLLHVAVSGIDNDTIYETRISARTRSFGRPTKDIWRKLDE